MVTDKNRSELNRKREKWKTDPNEDGSKPSFLIWQILFWEIEVWCPATGVMQFQPSKRKSRKMTTICSWMELHPQPGGAPSEDTVGLCGAMKSADLCLLRPPVVVELVQRFLTCFLFTTFYWGWIENIEPGLHSGRLVSFPFTPRKAPFLRWQELDTWTSAAVNDNTAATVCGNTLPKPVMSKAKTFFPSAVIFFPSLLRF